MENATKALLIAGSVLIAILLIAMGVKIFNSTSGTTEAAQSTMDATAIATFNNKFLQYIGDNKSKTQVISVANAIIANNATSDYKVQFSGFGQSSGPFTSSDDITTYINNNEEFKNSNKNIFHIKYNIDSTGRINKIEITYN